MEPESGRYCINVPQNVFSNAQIFVNRLHLTEHCKNILECTTSSFIITEVGVLYGGFSEALISIFKPQSFHMIDTYHMDPYFTYTDGMTVNHYDFIKNKFENIASVKLCKGYSNEVLDTFTNNFFDYIYVDAMHQYEYIKRDIVSAYNKIKSGGIIQFNDYTNYSKLENIDYGVFLAVNEFLKEYSQNTTVIGLSLDKNGYHDIAIQIRK